MPDTIRKQPPKKGAGKGKIGGISWQWWAAGLVVAIGVGLYLRHKSATAATSPTTTAAATDPSGGVSGGVSGSGSTDPNSAQPGIDTTGLQDAINQLGYVLGGGGGLFTSTAPFDFGSSTAATAPTAPYINSSSPGTIFTDSSGKTYAMQPSGSFAPAYIGPNGNYVSPLTYQGAGVTPQPITSQQVAPAKGIVTPQITPPADIVLRLPSAAAKKPATAKKK